ncbi:hypothetical protein AB4305_11220 [Nocardia sp. 2YAB30]
MTDSQVCAVLGPDDSNVAIASSTASVLLDWFRPVDTAHGL